MITARKFLGLPSGTRRRKLVRLLGDFEQCFTLGYTGPAPDQFIRLFEDIQRNLPEDLVDPVEWERFVRAAGSIHAAFAANRLRHLIMKESGILAAEWDRGQGDIAGTIAEEIESASFVIPVAEQRCLFLDDLRSPYNVGAIFRTAAFFGIDRILMTPDTPRPGNNRLDKTSMGMSSRIPWGVMTRNSFLEAAGSLPIPLLVLETGGEAISGTKLDNRGWMVLGNEELGVHPDILAAENIQILSIPATGIKASLNVSVAAGIALNHWCL